MSQSVQIPLFQGIDPADLERLLGCLGAARRRYRKGDVILAEGSPTTWVGVVLAGRVLMEKSDIFGGNTLLGSAGPGAVFAEAYACLPEEPLQISVTAAEETTVLFLQVGKVLAPCSRQCPFHAALIRNLLAVSAQKNLQLSRRIFHTQSKSIRGRLLSYFSEQAKAAGGSRFTIPYTRQQLADYLGVDRSALSATLSKMQQEGLIRYRRNDFEVVQPGKMP